MTVRVYAIGLLCASACAPREMTGGEVAAEVNRQHHPGTSRGWGVSSDTTFAGGQPNPCTCHEDPERRHWMLDC